MAEYNSNGRTHQSTKLIYKADWFYDISILEGIFHNALNIV